MSQKDIELNMITQLTKERGASFLHGAYPENITPIMVSDFISEFAKKVDPKSIIDPAAGIGSLIRIISDCLGNKHKISAIEINNFTFEKLEELSKGFPIDCIYGNCLEEIDKLKGNFDLAIGDLPRGILLKNYYEIKNKYKGVRTVGGAIILKTLERLNDGGYALFTNVNSFFSEYDKIKEYVETSGGYLLGVIKIPAGTYYPYTSVATNIFIFKKGKQKDDNVFIGTLDSENPAKLVDSFFSGKPSTTGKYISESKVKILSWNSVKAQDTIDSLVAKKKIKKIEGIKILSKLDLNESNSVFITTFGAPKIKLSLNEKEQKGRYVQLVLPKKYDRETFALYYNSKFGADLFSTVTAGSWLGSITIGKAKELDYYYPTTGADKAKLISKRIQQIKEALDLQSKLLDENIFDNLESVYNEVSKIELLTDIDYLMKLFPTIIVKPYTEYIDLKKNEDYTKAFDTLVNLTIALFMLGISVMWGGLKTNESIFNDMKDTIIKSVKRFGALTLGDMINMYASFAKAIRTHFSQDEGKDVILEAFGIRNKSTIDGMINKEIISVGAECGEIRNRKGGHKGATSKDDDKRHLELLENSVFELISKFEWLKNIKLFLYGGKLHVQNDGTLKVSGTIFNGLVPHSGDLFVDKPLKDNTLYFTFDELGKAIELPGLIRYGESTNDKHKVAYVYSRVNSFDKTQLDYLSYESYEEERAYSMDDVADDLFKTLLDNSQRV